MIVWVVTAFFCLRLQAADASDVQPEELYVFIGAVSSTLQSCDVDGFAGFLARDAKFAFADSSRRTVHPTRKEYLDFLKRLCRSAGPEPSFKTLSSSYNTGGSTPTIHLVLTREYQLGLIRRRRIKVIVDWRTTVRRKVGHRLEIARIFVREEYRDLKNNQIIPWEEAVPIPPLTRLQQMILGPWVLPGDREAAKKHHVKP